MTPITADVAVPPKSRTFTQDDARQVLALLNGTAEGQEAPAKNVGFGTFKTAGAARSAGVTLNRLLADLGATQKYAVTTFEREEGEGDDKTTVVVGVMLNKPAKTKAEAGESDNGDAPADTPAPTRRSRRSRS